MKTASRSATSYSSSVGDCKSPIEGGSLSVPKAPPGGNEVRRIQAVVAIAAGITIEELLERTSRRFQGRASTGCFRASQADAARSVAIHLAYDRTILNSGVLARLFRRDRTTILYHLRRPLNPAESELREKAEGLLVARLSIFAGWHGQGDAR